AYCWGKNDLGPLGDGTTIDRRTPVRVVGDLSFAAVSAGQDHTCGVTTTGAAYCWGYNGDSQLGDETTTTRLSPVPVAGDITFATISVSSFHSCGLTADGPPSAGEVTPWARSGTEPRPSGRARSP